MDSPEPNSQSTPGSSSHISATPNRPSEPSPFWPLPRLFIFKPHPAWNSSQIDERCFIYCSQNSRNRALGGDPWCRSICFRKVYGHEVHDESSDASHDINGILKPGGPLPLPPEGQPPDVISQGFVENNEKTKYWKQGRYIWVSKSRWAAQEKLDSMTLSLPGQTAWMRYKEMMERQRIAEEMDGNWPANADYDDDTEPYGAPESFRFPPSSAIAYSRDSLLFPITPLSTIVQEALHQKLSFILSPTYNLLMVFGRSFTEGTQTRFLEKAYQQATNGSTLTLIRNVWSKHESWFKLEKEEERKKKGGGSEGLS